MVEICSGFGAAVDDEVIDLLGLWTLEEYRVGLVGVLIGVVGMGVGVLLIVGVELLVVVVLIG